MTATDSNVIRSIVLIDDDADFLHVMQRRLQSQRSEYSTSGQVQIHVFTDPVEALVNLPAEDICVILIDYSMPNGTGLDWIPKLVKAGVGPVILLTNQNDAKVAAEAFRSGAADYLAKADAMTEDKRLGRTIREVAQRFRLETRNQNLTRQLKLLNVELEAKNKRLSELTENAHRFVDDVAHDFRTPLTVIQQYASIVAEGIGGPVTENQKSHLATVTEATRELAEMVDDFLDSSKLRARALTVDRQQHTVQELFDSIKLMLGVRAAPKRISIEYNSTGGISPFFGDLSKATRVLTNLAVNAIKVSPDGGKIVIWAKPTESGDIKVGVTDEGKGLSPEDLKTIFQRFKQVNDPQCAQSKGFGLGLSIVKQLAWLNFGVIDVQSERAKGSTFAFTLPACGVSSILKCFIASIHRLEEVGDIWMLRIVSCGAAMDVAALRRTISTFSYPMDLVLEGPTGNVVSAIGISHDAKAWANRIRKEVARFDRSINQQASTELDIKTNGPWIRDLDAAVIEKAILECLLTGKYDAQAHPANR